MDNVTSRTGLMQSGKWTYRSEQKTTIHSAHEKQLTAFVIETKVEMSLVLQLLSHCRSSLCHTYTRHRHAHTHTHTHTLQIVYSKTIPICQQQKQVKEWLYFCEKCNAKLRSVTCHIGLRSVICHSPHVNAPYFYPTQLGS